VLRYAQPALNPNGRHCLSVDSRFARINSYFCRQYGFSYYRRQTHALTSIRAVLRTARLEVYDLE
jgi:hypothetical protein